MDYAKSAWIELKEALGTDGWTADDTANYCSFFLLGWHAHQYATDPLLKEMAEAFEVIIRCLSHGLQDCKASITAKAMLQKYHDHKEE